MKHLAVVVMCLVALACAPSALANVSFGDGQGLQVVSTRQIDSRLYALQVKTAALPSPANVYVLLPPDYETQPDKTWPVFYLLHGTSGTASDWPNLGHAEQVIGDREVITVMPDIALNSDGGGWCTDWPNGAEKWETFHIGQLIPWVDQNLRTIPSRQGRAIAGLSQGGFCSLSYAARHPDLFQDALGYSGAPDVYYDQVDRTGAMFIVGATEMGLTHVPPSTFFGDQFSNGINWAAHDPATLAENLRSTHMYMYWGNGQPGPLDPNPWSSWSGASEIEAAINQSNNDFKKRLGALGIPAYFNGYGAGTHTWPYWERDLQWSIDKIMADFASPAPDPSPFSYTSADNAYSVYGWNVAMQRGAREFSTLSGVSCGGFTLTGSGTGSVTSAPCFTAGQSYTVTMTGPNANTTTTAVADGAGRLALSVPLGPANQFQQDTALGDATRKDYATHVTIQ